MRHSFPTFHMDTPQPSAPGNLPFADQPPSAPPSPAAPAATPAPQAAPGKYPGFGALLKRAIAIWKVQWWRMAILGILPLVIGFGIGVFMAGGLAAAVALVAAGSKIVFVIVPILALLFVLLVWIVAKLGAMHLQLALGADAGVGLREAWKLTKGKTGSFIWIGVLSSAVAGVGFLLLIAPGIIWGVSFAFAPYVLLRDGVKGRDALVRARQLVKGDLANVIVTFVALIVVNALVALPFSIAQGAFEQGSGGRAAVGFLNGVLNLLVIGPIFTGFMFAIFESLHARKSANLAPMPRAKLVYTIAAALGLLTLPLMIALLYGLSGLKRAAQMSALQREAFGEALVAPAADEPSADVEEPAPVTAAETDTDGDGMTDEIEASLGLDPLNPDTDGDGLGDGDEQTLIGTRAGNHDTDGDGYADASEILNGFSPTFAGEPLNETTLSIFRNALESGRFHEPTVTTLAPLRR